MLSQVNYFFDALDTHLFLVALLACIALLCTVLLVLIVTLLRPPHPPPDVSLLSPTLATELLGPHAARAWLLAVALDLYARDFPGDVLHLKDLGRCARLTLIHMRDERDPEAIAIAAALAACCHACAEVLHETNASLDHVRDICAKARNAIEATTSSLR